MFSALTSLLGSYLQARAMGKLAGELGEYFDRWLRLIASIVVSSYVTMLGTWSVAGLAALAKTGNIWLAVVFGFLSGLGATAFIILTLWTRSDLTRGIAIAVPSQLAQAAAEQNATITERK